MSGTSSSSQKAPCRSSDDRCSSPRSITGMVSLSPQLHAPVVSRIVSHLP
jgi:hypothetical protein